MNELDGRWDLRRTGGLLPPLRLLHKRIDGEEGATHLVGPLRVPFDVRQGEGGRAELVYPLGLLRDQLVPDGEGGWDGEARLLGFRVGRFRMRRDGASTDDPQGDPPA
ncbi:MAG TPA: hypothetical protein PKD59_12815 [Miltoncostaeaceae bacterium]|nr:hypothetical protein [Miltoncostaeaceae bacterium]